MQFSNRLFFFCRLFGAAVLPFGSVSRFPKMPEYEFGRRKGSMMLKPASQQQKLGVFCSRSE
jgi:hypothetical protein